MDSADKTVDDGADKTRLLGRPQSQALGQAILDSALDAIVEVGVEALSIADVARRAQTTPPAIYRRFASKAELLLAALEHDLMTVPEAVTDCGSLRADLHGWVLSIFEALSPRRTRILAGLAFQASMDPEPLAVFSRTLHRLGSRQWATIIRRAQQRGELREGEIPEVIGNVPGALAVQFALLRDFARDDGIANIVEVVMLPALLAAAGQGGPPKPDARASTSPNPTTHERVDPEMSSPATDASILTVPKGPGALVDPIADLAVKNDYDVNSWFAIGHFEAAGEVLNFLYHIMILPMPGGRAIQACVSITNETTGWYRADDVVVPLDQAMIADTGFDIEMPNGRLWGGLDDLHIKAALADGGGQVEIDAKATSPVITNGGTGIFPLIGMTIHQYSVPRLAARGTITVDGKTQSVEGVVWFDRQWQNQDSGSGVEATFRWSWMDINLDNGDAVSLWSGPATLGGEERAWATILHADGSQTVAAAEAGLGAREIWHSEKSGCRYPTRWTVRIPAMDAELEVVPSPREQEFVSQVTELNKYEGASTMAGTWRGKPARGFGYVELVGVWR